MSGPFGSSQWMYASGADFYNGQISQSLRFDGSTSKLTRTPSTSGNQKKWTTSFWVKRTELGVSHYLWSGASYSGNDGIAAIYFANDDKLHTYFDTSGANPYGAVNNRVYRDTSAWYHIVWAVDAENTVQRIWVNGVEETLNSGNNPPNFAYGMNRAGTLQAFGVASWGGSPDLNGYLAEIVHLDGQYLDETYFGEFKNGVWIPIEITGLTFGTNGFHLSFADSSSIGDDISGNTNDFTSTGLNSYDVVADCPENNMCTFNASGRRYGQSYVATFSEGGLKATNGGNATHIWGSMAINQIASQGGVYFEIRIDSLDTARTYMGVIGDNGADNKNSSSNGASYTYPIKGLVARSLYGYFATDSTSINLTSGNTVFSAGDVAGIAILSDGKFFMHRNGTYLKNASGNTGDPSTGTNEIATIDLTEGDWVPYAGYNSSFSINFGQDGSFSGNETSGGYQDENGIGDFMFAVPTNCFAICTSNMAEPNISPSQTTQADDYFSPTLYTSDNIGAGGTQSVTGVGFQPDWVWIKNRSSSGTSHTLFDSVRTAGKMLQSDTTSTEASNSQYGYLSSFDSDGFTLTGGTTNANFINQGTDTYVSWNWKAGGTAVSNTDGSITSSVSANTDAGFSIVSFTGTGANATVGHGLGVAPSMIIFKNRDNAYSWATYNVHIGAGNRLTLDETASSTASSTSFNSTDPTSSVFSVGTNVATNKLSDAIIAYCFAEVEGYSKINSFVGNSNADGTYVYLGFKPAWVLIRPTGVGQWLIFDSERNVYNPLGARLFAENSNAESDFTYLDFLSNGFKFRYSGAFNAGDVVYMAFAETPTKYSLAR